MAFGPNGPPIQAHLCVKGGSEALAFYEKAFGGPGCRDNPVGVGILDGDVPPNLFFAHDPKRVACFAPISRWWPARSALVPAPARAALDMPLPEILPGFDLRYFHAAPEDQRAARSE